MPCATRRKSLISTQVIPLLHTHLPDMSNSSPHDEPLPTFDEADVAALFQPLSSAIPPASNSPRLNLGICVPQVNSSFDSPITRAYSPALGKAGISQEDWLAFTDGLNVALVSSFLVGVIFR